MVDSELRNEEVDFPFTSEEGQAALSFRFLLHRCVDNLVYFPDARAVLKFRPGDEGRMGTVDFSAGCLKYIHLRMTNQGQLIYYHLYTLVYYC